jgi:hypothetical protein
VLFEVAFGFGGVPFECVSIYSIRPTRSFVESSVTGYPQSLSASCWKAEMAHITLAVTSGVIRQVKAGGPSQRQIAIRDAWPELLAPIRAASKTTRALIAINGVFDLSVGDTGAIWGVHQTAGLRQTTSPAYTTCWRDGPNGRSDSHGRHRRKTSVNEEDVNSGGRYPRGRPWAARVSPPHGSLAKLA